MRSRESTGRRRGGRQPGARGAAGRPLRDDPLAAAAIRLVAEARGILPLLLLHPSRCDAPVAEARQLAMYLLHVILQRNYAAIGASFRRDRTTVAHACAHIEDLRDEPGFDCEVAALEGELKALRTAAAGGQDVHA